MFLCLRMQRKMSLIVLFGTSVVTVEDSPSGGLNRRGFLFPDNLDEKLPSEVEFGGILTENAKDIILDVQFFTGTCK